jgi:hypothetical protein
MADSLPFPFKADVSAGYEKKDIVHTVRYESDTAEKCKPKIIRGVRKWIFFRKIVSFHYKGNDDYYILEIK